jgi:oligopeptidase B
MLENKSIEVSKPTHPQKPVSLVMHGDVRVDPYYWMRDRDSPEVLSALKREGAFYDDAANKTRATIDELAAEAIARLSPNEASVPARAGDYFYYSRFEPGKSYRIFCRKYLTLDNPEQIVVDVNKLAEGSSYCSAMNFEPSPDHKSIAFAVDLVGRRFYEVRVLDIATGELRCAPLSQTTGDFAWANDNRHLFVVKQDPTTLRPDRLVRFDCDQGRSDEVLHEPDPEYCLFVYRALTGKHLFLGSSQSESSESRYLSADEPFGEWTVFAPRDGKTRYLLIDGSDQFFVATNWGAENFRLMTAPLKSAPREEWREYLPERANTLLEGVLVFKDHIAARYRSAGSTSVTIKNRGRLELSQYVPSEEVSSVQFGWNLCYDAKEVRLITESLTKPATILDVELDTLRTTVKQVEQVPNYDPSRYHSERIWATASDGAQVPISLVYRKDKFERGRSPIVVFGYGAYGHSRDPVFSLTVPSLLDRGFVYAMAHVRGGSEMGRRWYDQGRLAHKINTFTDYIACVERLVGDGYCDPKRVVGYGRSAGGLLIGAVANMRADLFKALVLEVPFVDVVTTMLDHELPLTTNEYKEWGDPRIKADYDRLKSYSP